MVVIKTQHFPWHHLAISLSSLVQFCMLAARVVLCIGGQDTQGSALNFFGTGMLMCFKFNSIVKICTRQDSSLFIVLNTSLSQSKFLCTLSIAHFIIGKNQFQILYGVFIDIFQWMFFNRMNPFCTLLMSCSFIYVCWIISCLKVL